VNAIPGNIIKICGITSLEDAQEAIRGGANALGFNFYPGSPRYLKPDSPWIREITGVLKVGVFVDAPVEQVREYMDAFGLDVAQIHRGVIPEGPTPVWRTATLATFTPSPHPVLIDAPPRDGLLGGTGQTYDWAQLANLPGRLIAAGGLDASNAAEAIRLGRPWGVDACSKLESAPGVKDSHKMRAFAQAARDAFIRYATHPA
jgi:phosphoribosylanthranilate isomerase